MKSSTSNEVILAFVVSFFLAGCAQNQDIRMGDDYTAGTTAKSSSDYVACVQSELPGSSKTYTVKEDNGLKLFVDSTDPTTATGLIEVSAAGSQHQFSAYQRDAWYDKGRLLDAALMCSNT
ncbi:hypothetical protein [Pseudomonas tussilaginis]|uniref:hypothetical protein n=1 Tax=Pseudomonas sp. 5 TaxID=1619949 RepID=UPI0009E1D1A0|nr:hypothetical protein [Pseudomonas sp. 5]